MIWQSSLNLIYHHPTLSHFLIILSIIRCSITPSPLAISKDFGAYADVFTPDEVASEIFPAALRLIQDQEPDVRANAMKGRTDDC